jgi:hypothetical protein
MALVYLKNKKNDVTYVYECVSYWNKKKKKSESTRKCIGKLNTETGEIIPSKKLALADKEPSIASIKTIGSTVLHLRDNIS